VLLALNERFDLKLSQEALAEIAAPIGSDVPFFVFQSAALCKGYGEMVVPMKLKRQFSILLLKPAFAVSTGWAYSRWLDSREIPGFVTKPQEIQRSTFVNDLERPVFEKFVFLAELKMWLLSQSAGQAAALMSGSGSTMFAVMRENADAGSFSEACQSSTRSGTVDVRVQHALSQTRERRRPARGCGMNISRVVVLVRSFAIPVPLLTSMIWSRKSARALEFEVRRGFLHLLFQFAQQFGHVEIAAGLLNNGGGDFAPARMVCRLSCTARRTVCGVIPCFSLYPSASRAGIPKLR
jgi:hypothetical protein